MGRTKISIDDDLLEAAMAVTGATTEREAVDVALRNLISQCETYRELLALRGKLPWDDSVDMWRRSRS